MTDDTKDGIQLRTILNSSVRPIDGASITFFRIMFGLMMAGWAWDYLTSGRVTTLYVQPAFNFSYFGFEWVRPWPGAGMYLHFLALVALAISIAVGFCYRIAAFLFALGFSYVFLLDRTNYQNHYYLIGLISWWLPLLPLNRSVSIDALRNPRIATSSVPAWTLWILLFHISLPYVFGGVAKLSSDWLLGQPMSIMLSSKANLPLIGGWLAWPAMGWISSAMGLAFDLLVVPALLWNKTRWLAYLACIVFHLSNSVLFEIHIFPWFMLFASTLYFAPCWPRKVLQGASYAPLQLPIARDWNWTSVRALGFLFIVLYGSFQVVWPLRHRIYEGDASWNERGHVFAWRMMLRGKEVGIGYALQDPENGKVVNVNHRQFLAAEQSEKFPRDPEMILQMAHFIADKFEGSTGRRPAVYAFVLASLNGRKPQLLVDPNTDLAAVERGVFYERKWVPPLFEPLSEPAWAVPVEQWREFVELPEIEFLAKMKRQALSAAQPTEASLN